MNFTNFKLTRAAQQGVVIVTFDKDRATITLAYRVPHPEVLDVKEPHNHRLTLTDTTLWLSEQEVKVIDSSQTFRYLLAQYISKYFPTATRFCEWVWYGGPLVKNENTLTYEEMHAEGPLSVLCANEEMQKTHFVTDIEAVAITKKIHLIWDPPTQKNGESTQMAREKKETITDKIRRLIKEERFFVQEPPMSIIEELNKTSFSKMETFEEFKQRLGFDTDDGTPQNEQNTVNSYKNERDEAVREAHKAVLLKAIDTALANGDKNEFKRLCDAYANQ